MTVRANGDVYVNTRRSPYDSARQAPAGGLHRRPAGYQPGRQGRPSPALRRRAGNGGTGIAFFRTRSMWRHGADHPALPARARASWRPAARRIRSSPASRRKAAIPRTPSPSTPTGNLYVNSGSAHQRLPGGRTGEASSPGERPCKELATRAGIWRFSAHQTRPAVRPRRPLRHRDPERRRAGDQPGRRRALRHPARPRPAGGELAQALRLEAERGAALRRSCS